LTLSLSKNRRSFDAIDILKNIPTVTDVRIMDEFGPLDQEPVAMDDEEVASLLEDDGFKVVSKKLNLKPNPIPNPNPNPNPNPLLPSPKAPPLQPPSPYLAQRTLDPNPLTKI
jgi:hypothetical protein